MEDNTKLREAREALASAVKSFVTAHDNSAIAQADVQKSRAILMAAIADVRKALDSSRSNTFQSE